MVYRLYSGSIMCLVSGLDNENRVLVLNLAAFIVIYIFLVSLEAGTAQSFIPPVDFLIKPLALCTT